MKSNHRQLPSLKIETSPNNSLIITNNIPASSLHAMRDHYAIILQQIDDAISNEKQQREKITQINQEAHASRIKHDLRCIALARIIKRRNLPLKTAKLIYGQNQTLTRDAACKGRKLSRQCKKAAICTLHDAGHTQKRICMMLGYSAPYVSKEIKKHRQKAQQSLRLLAPVT